MSGSAHFGVLSDNTIFVYTIIMKRNITMSAEEEAIREGRRRAALEHTTLNELFRRWLDDYVARGSTTDRYPGLVTRLSHVRAGRKFTRDEMNER